MPGRHDRPDQPATRATEPERAAEGVREWQAQNLKTTTAEPGVREWQAHSFDSDDLGHGEEPATSFGSRIWSAVVERFAILRRLFSCAGADADERAGTEAGPRRRRLFQQ